MLLLWLLLVVVAVVFAAAVDAADVVLSGGFAHVVRRTDSTKLLVKLGRNSDCN